MASEYRGLIIKFGGDTSNLTAALKAATKSASETQTQITKMNKALKFDASSLTAAATKFKLIENRAESLQTKLKLTKDNAKLMGDAISKVSSGSTIKELAEQTNNAALKANLARQNYNELNKQLATLYTPINKAARESDDFAAKWKEITGLKFDAKNWHLHDAFQLDDSSFNKVIAALVNIEAVSLDTVEDIKKMRSEWQGVSNELSDASAVQAFKNIENEITLTTAELEHYKQMLKESVPPSDMYTGLETTRQKVSVLDDEVERLVNTVHSMDDALEVDPSNIEAATTRTKSLEQAIELCGKKVELLQDEIKQLGSNNNVKELANSSENLAVEFDNATDKVAELGTQLAEARSRVEALVNNAKNGDLTEEIDSATSEVEALSNNFEDATKRAQELSDAIALQQAQTNLIETQSKAQSLTNELKGTAEAAGKVESALSGSGFSWGTLSQIGDTLATSVTPVLQQVASAALDMANDFDSAYRDMRKTVDGTEKQFEDLKQAAIDFSNTNVTSASQMLEIQAIGGELGILIDDLDEFSTAISNISVATNIEDVETAAQDLGSLANIMDDLTSDKFTAFSDSLVRLGNNGASTESEIMDISQRIGSMASIVGMSTPEVLALASTIASTGQNSEAAGTAISNTMSDIETAVAKNSDSLQLFAETANMTSEQFAETWKSKPIEAIQAFIEGLKDLEANGESADKRLEDLGITGVRQKQALLGLMQTVGDLSDNLEMSQNAWDGVSDNWGKAGDAANEAQKKAEGLSGSMSRISNSAENIASKFGDALAPIIKNVADLMADASTAISGFNDSTVAGISAFTGVIATAGPAITIFSKLATFVTEAGGAFAVLSSALPIVGIAAVTGVAVTAYNAFKEWREEVEEEEATFKTFDEIVNEHADSVADLGDVYADIKPDVEGAMDSLKATNDALAENLDSYATNRAYLDIYIDTIEELANKSDLTAYEQAQLKEAVSGYNEITGSTVGIIDGVNGKLDTSTEIIKTNADAWLYNAKMQAYQTAMEGYIQDQADAEVAASIAAKQLTDATDRQAAAQKAYDEALNAASNDIMPQYNDAVVAAKDELDAANSELIECQEAAENANKTLDTAKESAEGATAAWQGMNEAVTGIKDAFANFGEDTTNKLSEFGLSVDTVSNAFADAGISAEQLNAVGSENFNQMLEVCGGDIGQLTELVQVYNSQGIVDKDGNINVNDVPLVDAQGNLYIYDGTDLKDKDGNIFVGQTELIDAQGNVVKYERTSLNDKDAKVTVTGATDAVSAAQRVRDALYSIPTKISSTIETIRKTIFGTGDAAGGIKHADGGFKIRKHAKGAIAHRVTPLDVVGEAGAEAIVPLTNKRYAMPFVKMISAETISQIEQRSKELANALSEQQDTERQNKALISAFNNLAGSVGNGGTTINQQFNNKIVRSDADMYSAATVLTRAALREAGV